MLLAISSAFDFVKFIQILCWIILPVFLLAGGLTIFFHHKKKVKKARAADEEEGFMQGSPELLGYTRGDGEYIFFDHSSLISDYKKKLCYNHARYTALHHDFEKLETKYTMLAQYTSNVLTNEKNNHMENMHESMPQHLETEIDKIYTDYAAEKKELMTRLEQLGISYKSLEQDYELLLEKVSTGTITDEERLAIFNRLKEENTALKDKIAEQEYLKEVIDVKKAEINFLQSQLEQRIKNNHQAENQRNQSLVDLEQIRLANEDALKQVELLKNELAHHLEESRRSELLLNEKEELLAERQQLLTSKLDHISWLENSLQEAKEQNELLNATVADHKDLMTALQEQLADEQNKRQAVEGKVVADRQALHRLYKEFSAIVGEENEASPVIALRPEYAKGNEETVAQ